ncbi:MAG: M15 family metallopeptidase [bacterium]|nr:M15 family metallopeptidase [bacterium]
MKYQIIASIGGLVLIGAVSYGVYNYDGLAKEKIRILSELEESRARNIELLNKSRVQQSIIGSFQGQISSIGQTVGTLEKLAATDEELLKKYSKVYFLNENYVPAKLTDIEKKYVYNGTTNFLIHTQVWPHLKRLLDDANSDGVDLIVASAFRSFDTQASLKSGYKVIYGSGANQFSADQGYSEHQLGTSVDFTTSTVGGDFSKFQDNAAYKWLEGNAYKYGFVLSYPEENTYYKFEPWHWRFVGVELATRLQREDKYFYDLDQRDIDAYLIKLFD